MEKLTHIWRVENDAGEGPYKPESNIAGVLADIPSAQAPLPMQDRGLCGIFGRAATYPGFTFGFESVASYKRWFSDEKLRQSLDDAGYMLSCYQVAKQNIRYGTAQIMFKKEGAALLGKCRSTEDAPEMIIRQLSLAKARVI
jgi:hypothetical protein